MLSGKIPSGNGGRFDQLLQAEIQHKVQSDPAIFVIFEFHIALFFHLFITYLLFSESYALWSQPGFEKYPNFEMFLRITKLFTFIVGSDPLMLSYTIQRSGKLC